MHHGDVPEDIARGLLALKDRIKAAKIPPSKIDESINIATWNIREFGKKKRSQAAIHYVAEILGQFDLIGLVELRDNLSDLGRVIQILGPYWRVVYSDAILDPGGNRERVAYLYDKRAVTFNGLAAEADAPRKKSGTEYLPRESFWRAPYVASFKAGNFDFIVITTHIRWGDDIKARERELSLLANWIDKNYMSDGSVDRDIIVMGDFNIPKVGDALFNAITSKGLQIPKALRGLEHGSNLEKNKRYDQILHYAHFPENFSNAGGVLDFYENPAIIKKLFPKGMSKADFTYQLSDHLPLWIQVNTDIEEFQLDQIVQG